MCVSVARHSALWLRGPRSTITFAMKWNLHQFDPYADRVRRSSREILVAAVLTVAAFAFLLAATLGGAVISDPKVGVIASDRIVIK